MSSPSHSLLRTAAIAAALASICGSLAQAAPLSPAGPPVSALHQDLRPRVEVDRNEDGIVDYVIINNVQGWTDEEQYDYDFDGKMDDFLYYEKGILVREEIDSDFDGRIDIWVYIAEGKYVERWERDLDGDGKPDKVRVYGIGEGG